MTLVAVGGETSAVPLFGVLTCSKGSAQETVTSTRTACVIGDELQLLEVTPEQIAERLTRLGSQAGGENRALDEQLLEALNLFCSSSFGANDPARTAGVRWAGTCLSGGFRTRRNGRRSL